MISIDYQDGRPIYEQIVEKYQILILKGVLAADEQLPSVRQMAAELSINPNTIQRAYAMLESDGYIYSVRGRGNFVSGDRSLFKKKEQDFLERLRSVLEEGEALGIDRDRISELTDQVYGRGQHD